MPYYVTVPLANIEIGKTLLVVFSNPARAWTAGLHQGEGRWLSQKIQFQVELLHPSGGVRYTDMCFSEKRQISLPQPINYFTATK